MSLGKLAKGQPAAFPNMNPWDQILVGLHNLTTSEPKAGHVRLRAPLFGAQKTIYEVWRDDG